jgi:methylated-DNA-[protein]-cysteine S-methyltransferase
VLVSSPWGTMAILGSSDAIERILFPDELKDEITKHPNALLRKAAEQLSEYFAGTRRTFSLPLASSGTAFQQRVWNGVAHVPYGATTTYQGLATEIGHPRASRAVGQALGRNPLPIIVPCHRVLSRNGVGGFSGGLDVKRGLLELESAC